jgi:hypothetical protein
MQRCRAKGLAIDLLPVVGAIETQEGYAPSSWSMRDARSAAGILGISPTIYKGGAAWFAMSALGVDPTLNGAAPVECSNFLPSQHPYSLGEMLPDHKGLIESDSAETDLPRLAAALGRLELSLQLEAAAGPSPGRARQLANIATRAMRWCPRWDLRSLFDGEQTFEFGAETISVVSNNASSRNFTSDKLSASRRKSPNRRTINNRKIRLAPTASRIYVDAQRLRILRNSIRLITNVPASDPASIFIIDIPLCGQSALTARMQSSTASDSLLIRITAIDQRQGQVIRTAEARFLDSNTANLSVPLHNMFGWITLMFEFSGTQEIDVAVRVLQIR